MARMNAGTQLLTVAVPCWINGVKLTTSLGLVHSITDTMMLSILTDILSRNLDSLILIWTILS